MKEGNKFKVIVMFSMQGSVKEWEEVFLKFDSSGKNNPALSIVQN